MTMRMLLLGAALAAGCGVPEAATGPRVDHVAAGREAFVTFDFVGARDGFAAALEENPTSAEAAYGHARSLMVLNEYEDALEAFDRALAIDDSDVRLHEGRLFTLVWGGRLWGRRQWLDAALESGGDTVRRFPESVDSYELVQDAAAEVGQPDLWHRILASLEEELGEEPVFRIHLRLAALAQAQAAGNDASIEMERTLLRELMQEQEREEEAAMEAGQPPFAGRRYLLATGYRTLEEPEPAATWLARLDETPEGRRMAGDMVHFDRFMRPYYADRDATTEQKLATLAAWKERFAPAWDNDDVTTYRVPLALELDLRITEARRQHEAGGRIDPVLLDRILALGGDLAWADTWGGGSLYAQVGAALNDLGVRHEAALDLAEQGIRELEEDRPGLLYPGDLGAERERSRANLTAALEVVRGQALAALGRPDEGEVALRRAVGLAPRSDRLAALGEMLAQQGRPTEAYPVLLAALAHQVDDERLRDGVERIRDLTLTALADSGGDESSFAADLEAARAEAVAGSRERIVAARLDTSAPDFELTALDGGEWRLSELRGKVVVLNYWATWCGPCRMEMPHYQSLVDEYAGEEDVVFLAITTDSDRTAPRDYLAENGYRFTTLFDEGSATDFQVTGVPAHFIVGPEGRLQYVATGFTGPERYAREMRWRIEALRAPASPGAN